MLFQTLSYIMEYCRYSKKRFFYIEPSSPDCKPLKLDLKELISFPKQCCQRGCVKNGTFSLYLNLKKKKMYEMEIEIEYESK
jgi:hypothetical protein